MWNGGGFAELSGYIAFNRRVTEGVWCYLAPTRSSQIRTASTACATTEYDHRFSKSFLLSTTIPSPSLLLCFSLLGFFFSSSSSLLSICCSLDVTDPRRLKVQKKSCFRSLTYTIKRQSC